MKNLILTLTLCIFTFTIIAQVDTSTTNSEYVTENKKVVKIILNDGSEHIGVLLKQDENIVLIETKKMGKISIPKYTIQEIIYLSGATDINNVNHLDFLREDPRFRRYVLTNSAIPYKQGDVIAVFDLLGPKFNFGIADGLSAGVSTSWLTIPVSINLKYAGKVTDNFYLAGGLSVSVQSIVNFESTMITPFATATLGNSIDHVSIGVQNHNFNGDFFEGLEGRSVTTISFAGNKSINRKYSFIFEAAYGDVNPSQSDFGDVIDMSLGFRYHPNSKNSYQFVLNGFFFQEDNVYETFPLPIPFFSWTRIL